MGTFSVTIEIGDPRGQRYEAAQALVDTGASFTVAPGSFLRRRGVTPHIQWPFETADGSRAELDIGETWVRVDGQAIRTLVVFGPEGRYLLGAYTLKGLRLAPDPVARRLIPVPGLLMGLAGPSAAGS